MKNPQKLSKKTCMKNLYDVLGVHSSASLKQIKEAFLYKKNLYKEDLVSLESLKMSYVILITPDLRAEYDAFRQMVGMRWATPLGNDIMKRGIVLSGSFNG